MSLIEGETGSWEMVIGLEVHAQVISESKLFSGASTRFGAAPNSQVSLVDAAMPGMLPVLNRACVAQAIRTGLGLKAQINLTSVFERKNYFYPDLPQGYQISQYEKPIVGNGTLTIDLPDGSTKDVGIERLHLEQDAGKSLHDQDPLHTYVDLNRSGVALMEIVSKPEMGSAEEAGAYVRKLRSLLRYLGTCDGNMEEGSLRCDVNLSLRRPGGPLGTRTETKNVNSIRFVQQAIEAEARRQLEILESGGTVVQETRLFDPKRGETRPMRSKEEAHDYRYFPDPDLLPLELEPAWVEELGAGLPELPDDKKARFLADYGLSTYDASVLVAEQENAAFYEALVKGGKKRDPKLAANWTITNYFGALNASGETLETAPVDADKLGGLLDLLADDTISGRQAKEVFEAMWESGKDALTIVEEKGLKQVSDAGELGAAVDKVIADNPAQVEKYRENPNVIGWFVGQVMKATQGKANPGMVNKLLKDKLG
ncbi:aspartyl/glutamyl-tRNA(Asn/Gln) amidotransferase subunit B [Tistlia consotensis]|uniref:Aspartyl/glutamyl-tRNA(Asn/Gln) amidotransferase subunit B n=1 Tax=Tistlia consotensis USBA 355 TaxID=560819 RepID=A0A1Y6C7Q4_9PROT|nr:Asp-tRNA(Asn)/Glu-tRNA(Gln) amidotransferase subunit GatB [Tistlia consotensis]SMF48236.1 aspartyl/glutamyl-tRNA(Asn/Gln) amidotransferase subunit B [Tistlia consotensis USBA 355]SNR81567.1 aspartyl/glutamyl-tRNA(Asn/Gln) amidotransferase subunit B [Tistlia consotensis]